MLLFLGHEADAMTLALSNDERTMVTGACDKTCKVSVSLTDVTEGLSLNLQSECIVD